MSYTHILRIEEFGKRGDTRNKWGYLMGLSMTPIIGYVEAWHQHKHWTLRVINHEQMGRKIYGITHEDKIDEADRKLYDLILEQIVHPLMDILKIEHPEMKIEISDKTRHKR